ncbi:hypothetical protein SEA_ROSMARINUS_94 [Mycobacterium Phage Rosmarinus]|nr:hypothetical protein SEA_ROSMARINUS_94 [Mycobacterium Phage Rosmarinus]
MSLAHMRRDWRASLLDCHPQQHSCTQNGPGAPKWSVGAVPIPGVDQRCAASYPRALVDVYARRRDPDTGAMRASARSAAAPRRVGWSPREHRRSVALQRSTRSGGGHLLHERKRHVRHRT